MCGIAGFFRPRGGEVTSAYILRCMTNVLQHRGPDDEGAWLDLEAGVALGHRRLAIIDTSPLGHQPMLSPSGRYVIVYNGEIYNFRDLRRELEQGGQPVQFAGSSDTEVVLAAFDAWGLDVTLQRMVGMFAFALWDRQERCLSLARDRMGEKPLYYGWMGDTFLFGSELKALRQHPGWRGELNRDSVTLLLQHSYIPGPYSIYKDVRKLPAGTVLCLNGSSTQGEPQLSAYWSLADVAQAGYQTPFVVDEIEAVDELERLLKLAVGRQMIADVPLGAFLSGGIDSSTIVALMQAQSTRPVRTFSIGFEEASYNEAPQAAVVARHLGTEHTELYVTTREAQAVIPRLSAIWDEPFADSSQIPTLLVAELARRQVTVALSGDGGDELFAGYPRYIDALSRDAVCRQVPPFAQGMLKRVPWRVYELAARMAESLGMPSGQNPIRHLQSLLQWFPYNAEESYRRQSLTHWQQPTRLVLGTCEPPTILTQRGAWPDASGLVERLSYLDLAFYLPEDILVKVDRASMAVSLEARVPLLDHKVVEFAQRVPMSLKLKSGQSKWLLRQVLYRYVPPALVDRPKMGFGVPIDSWLRSDLREWAEALLDADRLRRDGIFDAKLVRDAWQAHLSGKHDYHYQLWDILMFQQWHIDTASA